MADPAQNGPHVQGIVGPYFLVSFSPSSGVGVYEYTEITHRFDALPGPRDRTGKTFDEEGQIDAGIYFNSLNELLTICRREYLKDKKNACYSTLFTTHPSKTVCTKMLQFLNEPRLADIAISRVVLSVLREVAEAERVVAVIVQAHEMRLKHVEACLATEFRDIVFAPATMDHLKTASGSAETIALKLREYGHPRAGAPLSPSAPEGW